ncbi:MAG TPA: asparagine synthase (glutamine-hydrolyzing) [Thermoanaerobaculia bacterium]|nr:asparagine synthase (glutamine-hydrolyzing) [Thermoanaerobaculia bacterium]
MCGITAIFAYRSNAAGVRSEELNAITESMRARGPDAGGTWISTDARVGIGARRLAIIDLSAEGTQPMFDVERELVIAFNGEIYNYRELCASLERGGARFHSHTDTEVLLRLYRRDGERMLGLLRGMYAFVIWDTRARRMFVARDPYGIKPLYVSDDGGTIRIASEVKALLAGGAVSRAVDPAGVAGFFLTGSVPEPFTIREAVRAVEAGTAFHVDEERGRGDVLRHESVARVFRRASMQRPTAHLTQAGVALRERIEESVAHHLVADVPIGVFLSSGIDSSALAAIASRLSREPLHTFTLAFEEFRGRHGDEAPLAERFAREIGAIHTTRIVTREEFHADLPNFLAAMDQPTIDGVNTWFVSKAAHEAGIKVVLSGLGGDELLGGYPSFANIPTMMRLARTPLAWLMSFSRHPKKRLLREYGGTYAGAYLLQRGLFLPHEVCVECGNASCRCRSVEKRRLASPHSTLDILERFEAAIDPDPGTPFGRIASLEASLYMRNQLLRDADWTSMAHSVEVRTPFVDIALLRQIAPLVLEYRETGKRVLGSMLPPWLRDRPKTGFFVPIREWMDLPPDGTTTRMRSWARSVFEATAGA